MSPPADLFLCRSAGTLAPTAPPCWGERADQAAAPAVAAVEWPGWQCQRAGRVGTLGLARFGKHKEFCMPQPFTGSFGSTHHPIVMPSQVQLQAQAQAKGLLDAALTKAQSECLCRGHLGR